MTNDAKEKFIRELAIELIKSSGVPGEEADSRSMADDDEAVTDGYFERPAASSWMDRLNKKK